MTNQLLHILQHSLGVGDYGDKPSFRNHFGTGPGGDDWGHCMTLVGQGLMVQLRGNALTGGSDLFKVTPRGVDYVALNSPKRPPQPKLTRSQQRYQDYRRSEFSGSFAEYLGVAA